MKQLLRFKTFLILALLAMVGNSAWAQSTSTLTFSAKCNGSGTADDGVYWTVTSDGSESNFDNNKGIHYGTGSQQVQYIKLSTSQIEGTITSVVVNASTASGVSATVDVTVGGEAFGDSPQSLSASAANYTFNGSASGEIVVTVTKPSKATKAIYVKSVTVTYTSGGGSTLTDNDLALTDAPVALSFDLYNNATPQVISYTTSSTGDISVGNNDYATFEVDQTKKTITVTPTAVTPSAQTITVNQAADDTYKAGSVTFTINVTNSNPAVNNISDITAAGTYKVRGTIVAKSQRGFIVGDGTGYVYYYNQNYTQADYNIGDMVELNGSVVAYGGVFEFNNTTTVTAATSSNYVAENPTVLSGADMDTRVASTTPTQLSSYVQYEGTLTVSGTYYNITSIDGASTAMGSISYPLNTDFTSLNGKKVKVTGYYVGISSSKYYNTMIGSIEEVVVTTPTLTVEPAVVNVPYTGGNGDFTVSPSNVDNAFGAYITYYDPANTENTASSDPEWLNVGYDYSNLSLSYSVTEENTTGAARTACFKYSVMCDGGVALSNMITVTQAAYIADYATLPFTFDGGRADIETTAGLTQEGLDSDYASSPKLKFNGTGDYVILKFNERPGTLTFDIKGNSFSGGTFTVQTSEDGDTYTDLKTYTELGATQSEMFNTLGENVRYIKWVYTEKSSGNVALGNIALAKYSAPAPSITISPDSYTMDAKAGGGELPVTCSNMPADPQLEVLFYESDGTTSATYDWISATINANGNIDGQIEENTGDARTAYFKVHGVDADNNDVYSNLVTFTQEAPVAATPTIVFNPESIDFDANSGYRTIGGDYFQLKDFDSTPSLEILYYESDGDTEKQGGYDWLTADFNSNNQIDFTWGTNTGAARSAYLKIHAVGTTVYSNLFTVNQAAANVAHYYQKVTADADLADGQYLIVYEDGSVAFDGGLSTLDATSNTIDVTIVGDKIEGNSTTDAATFTIDVTAGTLQSASGLYIGQTSDANGLKADGSTAYQNTLSIDADGNADVISSSAHLRYNATSGQDRFRYFKSASYTGQKAIQLYKRVEGAMPAYVATPTFDPAAGEVQAGTLVTISTTTANATIRYTTDGSEPTTSNGEEYQKPIVINSDVTIKAIAVDDNQNVSAVAEATYTIATSSQLSPELTLDPKSLNVTEGAANGTVTVTTAAGYNGTITVMVDDPSVADASYDAGVITVVYGHAGSAVISVTAGADGDYVEQMEQISVNVSAPVQPAQAGVVVWSEDWSSFDLSTDGETPAANGDFTYVYTNGDNATKLYDDVLAGGTSPELLINKNGGAFSATIPLYGAYGNMTLTFKTNNKLSEIHAKVDDDTNNNITADPATVNGKNVYTLSFPVAEGANQVVLTFTNSSSKNLRIDDFQLTAPQVAVNISSVGYATMYYGSSNLVVPAGVTASTYWVDGDLLKVSQEYTEGDVLPKAQGYVLNGAPGSYTFTATNDAANEDPKNLLCGSDVAVTTTAPAAGDYLFYLLGVDNGKVGFYWGKAEGAAFKSGAHKAYLAVPTEVAAGVRGFTFDGTTVGINTIGVDMPEGNAYDLQGRRVQQFQKNGLYIVGGKKMLAK